MVKRSTKITAFFDRLMDGCALVAAVLIIFIMLAICLEVVARRVGYPQKWVMEITEYCLLFIAFLGAAWLLRREEHVKMDILVTALNPGIQGLFGTITSLMGVIISLVLLVFGTIVTWDYFQRGVFRPTPLLTPAAPLYAIIPLGSFLLLIQFVRRTCGYFRIWKEPRDKEQESTDKQGNRSIGDE